MNRIKALRDILARMPPIEDLAVAFETDHQRIDSPTVDLYDAFLAGARAVLEEARKLATRDDCVFADPLRLKLSDLVALFEEDKKA